jgi:cysteine desulfurase
MHSKKIYYFDNCATTRVLERVSDVVIRYNTQEFINPSTQYDSSLFLQREISDARKSISESISRGGSVIFTSGGTEANNLAIFGSVNQGLCTVNRGSEAACSFNRQADISIITNTIIKNQKPKTSNIVTSKAEHPSVYNAINELNGRGLEIRYAPLNGDGSIDISGFSKLVDSNTRLVALMHVNNETGAVNNLFTLAEITKAKSGALFFADGVQGFLKIPLQNAKIDLYSFSGHKAHAPKGVGGLWVRSGVRLTKQIFGGGQEGGVRSGTENVPGIMALSEAVKIFNEHKAHGIPRLNELMSYKATVLKGLDESGISYKTISQNSSPFILSLLFKDVKGEVLMRMLEDKDILVGIGSACSTKRGKKSRVLEAVNTPSDYIEGLIRIGFSLETTRMEADYLIESLISCIRRLNLMKR